MPFINDDEFVVPVKLPEPKKNTQEEYEKNHKIEINKQTIKYDDPRYIELVNIFKELNIDYIIPQWKPLFENFYTAFKCSISDSSVLLLGETGTGKEIIANIIHNTYIKFNKKNHKKIFKMITINVNAISENLIESELFGHIKGAFTGALKDKIGKIQESDDSCLFLDEIGDLAIQSQIKLLRVLENKIIIKVGDTENNSRKVDFKLITATNKNLTKAIKDKKFRIDFFMRISTHIIDLKTPTQYFYEIDSEKYINYYADKRKIALSPEEISDIKNNILLKTKDNNNKLVGNIREMVNIIQKKIDEIDFENKKKSIIDMPVILNEKKSKENRGPKKRDTKYLTIEDVINAAEINYADVLFNLTAVKSENILKILIEHNNTINLKKHQLDHFIYTQQITIANFPNYTFNEKGENEYWSMNAIKQYLKQNSDTIKKKFMDQS